MAEYVGHGIKYDRRRGTLCAYLRRQGHHAVRLAAHESAGRGVVEGKARNGNLVEPPEVDLGLLVRAAPYYNIPCGGIEYIQKGP